MRDDNVINFVSRHEVVILDLCHTFMFDCDRFSDSKSYSRAYTKIGGTRLSDLQVESAIERTFSILHDAGKHPENFEAFPQVRTVLAAVAKELNINSDEIEFLEEVFALHEVGTIPTDYAEVLKELRKKHRLGLLSNIWVRKTKYEEEMKKAGTYGLFENIVFSSDHGMLKPSRKLFDIALEPFRIDRSKVVYIGDSFERDVVGAKWSGLSSVWISLGKPVPEGSILRPDQIIDDLRNLAGGSVS